MDWNVQINSKYDLDRFIETRLADGHLCVSDIKTEIEQLTRRSLSDVDTAHVNHKYSATCKKLVLNETINVIDLTLRLKRTNDVFESALQLCTVDEYDEFVKRFEDFRAKYCNRIEVTYLDLSADGLFKETQREVMKEFKRLCLTIVKTASETIRIELEFLDSLVDILCGYRSRKIEGLQLERFCDGKLLFNDLLKRALRLPDANEYDDLKSLAKRLFGKEITLLDRMKRIVRVLIQPVEYDVKIIDGRRVAIAKATILVLGDVLPRIEELLSDCSEAHFVAAKKFHADRMLENNVWHGKNVVVYADVFEIHDGIVWDVSGIDSVVHYEGKAGKGCDGEGENGCDGRSGESGGNVLIRCNRVVNGNMLTIVSNGGNGTNGQDGGDGKDGVDGTGITEREFKMRFPATSVFVLQKKKVNINKTLENSKVQEQIEMSNDRRYQKYVDTEGFTLTFSHYDYWLAEQSFLLYEGRVANPGKQGGAPGFAGEPGYSGEVTIRPDSSEIKLKLIPGKNGKNGSPGKCGKSGTPGWDMGYIDKVFWPHRELVGGENVRLKLQEYDEKESDRIWCDFKNKYISIEPHPAEQIQVLTSRTRERETLDVKARASRQKAIVENTIFEAYHKYIDNNEINAFANTYKSLEEIEKHTTTECDHESTELNIQQHYLSDTSITSPNETIYDLSFIEYNFKKCHNNNLEILNKLYYKIDDFQMKIDENVSIEDVDRFLIRKPFCTGVVHETLGQFDQYFEDGHEKNNSRIFEFYKEKISNKEVPGKLVQNIKVSVIKKFQNIIGNDSRNKDSDFPILANFIKTFVVESTKRNRISESIQDLYDAWNVTDSEFNWIDSLNDEKFTSCIINQIQEKGPLLFAYRQLIADTFNVKIFFYTPDENNKPYLIDTTSNDAKPVRILYDNGCFVLLDVDNDFLNLEKERLFKSAIYSQILNAFKKPNINENETVYYIMKFFPNYKYKTQLLQLLEKFKSVYVSDNANILYHVLYRFKIEGRIVCGETLYCFLTAALKSKSKSSFAWILSTCSQGFWMIELSLLKIEDVTRKLIFKKNNMRDVLYKISEKNLAILTLMYLKLERFDGISLQFIIDTLHLLKNIRDLRNTNHGYLHELKEVAFSEWFYMLKEWFWKQKLRDLSQTWTPDSLESCTYFLLTLDNHFGRFHVTDLLQIFKEKKTNENVNTFGKLISEVLQKLYTEEWVLNKNILDKLVKHDVNDWRLIGDDKTNVRDFKRIIELIRNNGNTSKNIEANLDRIKRRVSYDSVCTTDDAREKAEKGQSVDEVLDVIDDVIKLKRGFSLRDTQRIAVSIFLNNEKNTLAQISTGEGKTMIVVVLSIIKALRREKVHVITSSSVLARRDAEINKDIFEVFGLKVSHNCYDNIEKRKVAYLNNDVVYGDLSNFQRDYLLDHFFNKNVLDASTLQNVIVDEVDSMLLDKGNNVLYLSQDIAGLDKLEPMYIHIWQLINAILKSGDIVDLDAIVERIRELVYYKTFPIITKDDLKNLDARLTPTEIKTIWDKLIDNGVIDSNGRLLRNNYDYTGFSSKFAHRISYLMQQELDRQHQTVPEFLKPFIDAHIDSWIKNAIRAYFMEEREDYIVDVDRTGSDCNPTIIILDTDTGTDLSNSQWDEALHQFLQLKHGCKLTMQSLKSVFVSNVTFFKLYTKMYGLTGTLGSMRERDMLKAIHEVDFVIIPTAKPKQFYEEPPIFCKGQNDWKCQVHRRALEMIKRGRSVLIICELVRDVRLLQQEFSIPVQTYVRDYEEFGDGELEPGRIIISTNLAGRGTDIKLSEQLRNAGGLHVCLTYLPRNTRIEQQAMGRAARCGELGSGQLIIIDREKTRQGNFKTLNIKKKQRDAEELKRLVHVKHYYETAIKTEEDVFDQFKNRYDRVNQNEKNITIKTLVLQNFIERWAFWLDEHRNDLENMSQMCSALKDFITLSETINNALQSRDVEKLLITIEKSHFNPIILMKLAKICLGEKEYNNAVTLFDYVLKTEPLFSSTCYYYKSFALIKREEYKLAKHSLQKALFAFSKEYNEISRCVHIVDDLKENNKTNIVQIEAYENQQRYRKENINAFVKSIRDIIGYGISPENFSSFVDNETAEAIFSTIIENGYVTKPKVKKNIPKLDKICIDFNLPIETLSDFLSDLNGKEITFRDFEHQLRSIKLPSVDQLWTILIDKKVFVDQEQYTVVNRAKLGKVFPSLLEKLDGHIKFHIDPSTLAADITLTHFQSENVIIFRKHIYEEIVATNYVYLRRKGVSIVNKTARFDNKSVDTLKLPSFDSLTRQDVARVVNEQEADLVLDELVHENILLKENDRYRLINRNYHQMQLTPCPIYKPAIITLLDSAFCYRIILWKIIDEIANGKPVVLEEYIRDGHKGLMYAMIDAGVIKLPKFQSKGDVYEKKYTEAEMRELIENTGSDGPETIKKLVGKEALVRHQNEEFKKWMKETLCEPKKWDENAFLQNEKTQEQFQKLGYVYGIREERLSKSGVSDRVVSLLKTEAYENESVRKKIEMTVMSSENILKRLETTDCSLKPLKDYNFNLNELRLFEINAQNQIIYIHEKKWSLKMLIGASSVLLSGIIHIAAGITLNVYSSGIAVNIGSTVFHEGLQDILFSITAFARGTFKWSEYGISKMMSLLSSSISIGANLLKKVPYVAKVGSKLFGSKFGSGVVEEVGVGIRTVVKSSLMTALSSVVLTAVNIGVDTFVEQHLQVFCNKVASELMFDIETEVKKHNLPETLRVYHARYGDKKAREILRHLTEKVIKEDYGFKSKTTQYVEIVTNVLVREFTTSNSDSAVSILNSVSQIINFTTPLLKTANEIKNFFVALNNELETFLVINEVPEVAHGADNFIADMNEFWESIIRKKIEICVQEYVVKPIVKYAGMKLLRYIEYKVKTQYEKYKDGKCKEKYDDLKKQYEKALKDLERSKNIKRKCKITEEYYQDVRTLAVESKNPNLLAEIVRENVPLDIKLVEAYSIAFTKFFDDLNVPNDGFTLHLITDSTNETVTIGNGTRIITVDLPNKRFQNSDSETWHDASYNSLTEAFLKETCFGATPQVFNKILSNIIEKDEIVQHRIFTVWTDLKYRKPSWENSIIPTAETERPYENDFYKFNKTTDIDLRNTEHSPEQLQTAFKKALSSVNKHLRNITDDDSHSLKPEHFTATRFVTASDMKINDQPVSAPHSFPVEMKTTVSDKNQMYKICINLDNPQGTTKGPSGPHVGYSINCKRGENRGKLTGHVLLNRNERLPDRHQSTTSMNDGPSVLVKDLFKSKLEFLDYAHSV